MPPQQTGATAIPRRPGRRDGAVSPVIATILMVAITVVLAATVWYWVSGHDSEEEPSFASAAARGYDANNNAATDWVRLTLTRSDGLTYSERSIHLSVIGPNGVLTYGDSDGDGVHDGDDILCTTPAAIVVSGKRVCDGVVLGDPSQWDPGATLYVPCQANGEHTLVLTLRSTVILDTKVRCEETPA